MSRVPRRPAARLLLLPRCEESPDSPRPTMAGMQTTFAGEILQFLKEARRASRPIEGLDGLSVLALRCEGAFALMKACCRSAKKDFALTRLPLSGEVGRRQLPRP